MYGKIGFFCRLDKLLLPPSEFFPFPWSNSAFIYAQAAIRNHQVAINTKYLRKTFADKKKPGETDATYAARQKIAADALKSITDLVHDADQITLGGFSQGCLMSLETGLHYPHRLAGIVGISGWVFEIEKLIRDLTPVAKSQRLLVTHGHYDPLLPFTEAQKQVRQLKAAGLNVAWHEFPKEHTIHGEEEIAVIREFVRAGYAVVGK